MKTTLKQLILGLSVSLLVGCGTGASTKSDAPTQTQNIKLNVTLEQTLQKSNPTRFEKQSDISDVRLDVEGQSGFIYQNQSLTQQNGKWTISLLLSDIDAPFIFRAYALDAAENIIYSGESTVKSLSSQSDINLTLISTQAPQLNDLPFVKSITQQSTSFGIDLNFTIVNASQDTLSYLLAPRNVASGCQNTFNPSTGTLSFTNSSITSFKSLLNPDNNSSCQTTSYSLKLTKSNGDSTTHIFTFANNTININLPPDIQKISLVKSTATDFELTLDASDPDGPAPMKYNWRVTEGSVTVAGSTNQQNPLLLTNYSGKGRIILDVNVSDSGGASTHIGYVMQDAPEFDILFITQDTQTSQKRLMKVTPTGEVNVVKVLSKATSNDLSMFTSNNSVQINNILYFTTSDDTNGVELWKSDGTIIGSKMVKDINPNRSSSPNWLTNVNGTLYFRASDGTNGFELWKSDGTAAGTVMVKDINPNADSFPKDFTNINGTLYFSADDGTNGYELWKSNGTAAGTVMVKDINPNGDSAPSDLANINGTLYFNATDGINGNELWKSDGTANGTVLVKNINPNGDSFSSWLTDMNGTLYFVASDGTSGAELWKSDGTATGTVMVKNINPNGSSFIQNLINLNGVLYFGASDGMIGYELWKSDGTEAGTVMVKDINLNGDSFPSDLANINGTLYFAASDGTNGYELWKSDGTATGTVMVKDINPNGNGIDLSNSSFININNTLYFMADSNGDNIDELWKSDGTANGTIKVY